MVVVGLANISIHTRSLLFGRNQIIGSLIGGLKETPRNAKFCSEE